MITVSNRQMVKPQNVKPRQKIYRYIICSIRVSSKQCGNTVSKNILRVKRLSWVLFVMYCMNKLHREGL